MRLQQRRGYAVRPVELWLLLLVSGLADDVAGADRHYLTRAVDPLLRGRARDPHDELPLRDGPIGGHGLRLALEARGHAVVNGVGAGLNRGDVPDDRAGLVGSQGAEAEGVGLRGLGPGRGGLAGELREAL